MSMLVLPTELVDAVASYVDAREDLLSFALTCRAFKCIAVPRHIDYRLVRCHHRRHTVWRHLAARPDLARNVRVVEVVGELDPTRYGPERVPSFLCEAKIKAAKRERRPSNAEGLALVGEALGKMVNLQKFTWSTSLCFTREAEREAEAGIWLAVSRHQLVKHVEFVQAINPPAAFLAGPSTYPMWSMTNLKSLLVENAAFLRQEESVRCFAGVLQHSPGLESLRLALYDWSFNMAHLFSNITLPNLLCLSLEIYADPDANAKPFAEFLERTPSLQSLKFQYLSLRPLKPGSLPSLKRVSTDQGEDEPLTTILADSQGRALEEVSGIPLNDRYLDLLKNVDGNALRRLEVTWFDSIEALLRVAEMFPRLVWLRVPSVDYMYDWAGVTKAPVHLGQWARVLDCFPGLEVFHGIAFFRDPKGSTMIVDNDERAREIALMSETLYRVDHWEADPGKAIFIVRGDEGVTWREASVPLQDP